MFTDCGEKKLNDKCIVHLLLSVLATSVLLFITDNLKLSKAVFKVREKYISLTVKSALLYFRLFVLQFVAD